MIFKGIDSRSINGLIICKEPPISSPPKRINKIEIEGRDGDEIEELGYEAYDKSVEIGITQNVNVDNILKYFNGSGDLIFECENDKVYKAGIYQQIDLERLVRFRTGNVVFHCQPYKYKRNDKFITATDIVWNEGNAYSNPILRLEKTTDNIVDITINEIRFTYEFNTNDTYVEIDCEEMNALYEGLNRNRNLMIGYDFPNLKPGENTIHINSGNVIIKIKRKDRWI